MGYERPNSVDQKKTPQIPNNDEGPIKYIVLTRKLSIYSKSKGHQRQASHGGKEHTHIGLRKRRLK